MIVVDFMPEHIAQLQNYGGQERLVEIASPAQLLELHLRSPGAITVIKENQPIACGGVAHSNSFRGLVWALFQRTTPRDFVFIHRASLDVIRKTKLHRIEAFVDPSFKAAMRWIELLGFTMEHPYIPWYFENGAGASYWAMHK